MKPLPRLGLLALALTGSSASIPENAAACSCATLITRQSLELVRVEALDGGKVVVEEAFWPEQATLVYKEGDYAFQSESLEIALNKVDP